MTKRNLYSDDKNNSKKIKLNGEIDELWGDDDLDDSVFDDCVKIASQALSQDVSLPTYDGFKAPKPICSSTQLSFTLNSNNPTTSKYITSSNEKYGNIDFQSLKQTCEEKDGEISVLRGQLREVKAQINIEQQKAQTEWKAKLTLSEKQVQTMASKLEFKNLEISHLKQKISSLTKNSLNLNNTASSTLKGSPKLSASISKIVDDNRIQQKRYVTTIVDYPLKNIINESVFTIPKAEKFIIENKLTHTFKSTIPFLQNKNKSTRTIVEKARINVNDSYLTILKLCGYTVPELNSSSSNEQIAKILHTCSESLDDLLELLLEIKSKLRTDDLLEEDSRYVKNQKNNDRDCKDILGRKSAFLLIFLSTLLPYSLYLKEYFLRGDQTPKKLIRKNTRKIKSGPNFLNQLVNILVIIGEIRKANVMPSFLLSTIKLFTNICKIKGYAKLREIICTAIKELFFLRPFHNVTFELTYLLREISKDTYIVQFLLNKSNNECSTRKGLLYFNKDACRFYVFVLIFYQNLSKNKTVPLKICLNMLYFIYNTYKSSYFLHHLELKECECLPQLYKMVIEIIFRLLENNNELKTGQTTSGENAIDNKIVLKILNLMAHHCYELTERYITVHSQFKQIERRLRSQGVCDLDRLNIIEEIPIIDNKSFNNIDF